MKIGACPLPPAALSTGSLGLSSELWAFGASKTWAQGEAGLAPPLLHQKWVTVSTGLPASVVLAPDSTFLAVLPSWVLLLHLRGYAAVVPSHLPSDRLHHGLAYQGLCGRPR